MIPPNNRHSNEFSTHQEVNIQNPLPQQIDPLIKVIGTEHLGKQDEVSQASLQGKIVVTQEQQFFNEAILQLQDAVTNDVPLESVKLWISNFGEKFKNEDIQKLSKSQLLHLGSCLLEAQKHVPEINEISVTQNLPPLVHKYQHILDIPPEKSTFKEKIFQLSELNEEEQFEAIAHYVTYNKTLISYLNKTLSKSEMEKLIPHLRYVDLRLLTNTTLATNIINNCPNLNMLFIDNLNIEELPDLPNCRSLTYTCSHLTKLGALPNCRFLELNCEKLNTLPDLPNCQILKTSGTPLNNLPKLPNCEYLDISRNLILSDLPDLPNCHTLLCPNNKLKQLPELPNCEDLKCNNSHFLTTLPALPKCKDLDCSNCHQLITMQDLQNCVSLTCTKCIRLTMIPPLPKCKELNLRTCLSLQELPELPEDANIYSDNTPTTKFTKIEIEVKDFSTRPRDLLLNIGRNFLLKKIPFPNVYYLENGIHSPAIDVGGVRRDFITRISENLFHEKESDGKVSEIIGLPLVRGYPVDDESTDAIDSYRSLGKIFARCYPESAYFKTGPLFPVEVSLQIYNCITSPGDPSKLSDDWLIAGYLALNSAPDIINAIIDPVQKVPILNEKELAILTYIVDSTGETSVDQSYFDSMDNRVEMRKNLLALAKSSPHVETLRAISYIAGSMKESFSQVKEWDALCAAGGKVLQERIEGKLSKDALLKNLVWDASSNVPEINKEKTQKYLEDWIKSANFDQLTLFVRAISSNKTLGPQSSK